MNISKYSFPTRIKSLSIVLPAYNEAENISIAIEEALNGAKKITSDIELIVVNDGSSDNTEQIVVTAMKAHPEIKIINNSENLGYGPTVRKGLEAVVKEWVFFTDSDLQFDLNELTKLIPFTDRFDFIVGNRAKRKDKFIRKINAAIYNLAAKAFFGIKIKDIDCAFKLMKRSKLHSFELISESAMTNTEIIHRARVAGFKIKQVAVTHRPRVAGSQSGGNYRVILKAVKEFYRLRWILLKSSDAKVKINSRFIFIGTLLFGTIATIWSFKNGYILAYGDAEAHINIAKRVVSGLTPGLAQLGGIWLPLPHLLMAPLVSIDYLWRTGLAGSIVSVLSLSVMNIFMYRLAYLITKNHLASYIAPLLLVLNPNILYLSTTPMTEILLLTMFTGSVYYLANWLDKGRTYDLVIASIFAAFASISRYDGWALVCLEIALIIFVMVLKRKPFKTIEGVTFLFSFAAFIGIALWLAWNKIIFNSFTYFSESVYGSKEQQLFFLKSGYLPTYHNLEKSIIYFLEDVRLVVGLPLIIFAIIGMTLFVTQMLKQKKFKMLGILLLVATPIIFYTVSLYLGQASLILPTFALPGDKYTLSNTRYGIQILLLIAVFCAYLGAKYKKLIPVIAVVAAVQGIYFVNTQTVITFNDGTYGLSSQRISKGPDAIPAEKYMHQTYDDGYVLMDDYRRPIGIIASGIPMKSFIGSGNKPYWPESLDNPAKYAKWIVLQKADTDALWKNMKRKDLIDSQFNEVFQSGNIYVYKHK